MKTILPPNWSWVKLGDVSKRIHYGYTASAQEKTVGPKLLRITDIQNGKVDWSEVPFCEITKEEVEKYLLKENDIVFARTGATVGKSFLIKGRIPKSVFASYLIRLQLLDKTLPAYIYLFFQSNNYWSQIKSNSAGIGQPNVNAQKLINLSIPLPPLPEQKKIVEKIEELFSGLDSGVSSLKKAKEQIRLYRQSVLSAAFSGKLTQEARGERLNGIQEAAKAAEPRVGYGNNLPDGWKWVKLEEVIDSMQYGTSDKAIGNETGIPVLRMGNIQDGKLDFTSLKYFDKSFTDLNKYLLDDGDVLFNRTNSAELVGKSAIYKKHLPKSIFASYLIRVKVTKNIYSPDFLNYYINSTFGRDFIKSVVSQNVGQANVNGTKLKGMLIPLCSLNQQTQIVEEIEKRFSEADNLEKAIDESLAKSETLRQSILKQAFEGRLV
ncbi:MAG: restriction endonuclease subunit S [Ignavibacteriales bacterium]|nr:MAG: restriction endonuclease subunit S [Ignavibacteriales bacterium]